VARAVAIFKTAIRMANIELAFSPTQGRALPEPRKRNLGNGLTAHYRTPNRDELDSKELKRLEARIEAISD